MEVTIVLKALANERRLQILEWLKDPRAHFRPQVDGDLVDDGVCALLIAEKLEVSAPTLSEHMRVLVGAGLVKSKRIKGWTMYKRDERVIAAAKKVIQSSLWDEPTMHETYDKLIALLDATMLPIVWSIMCLKGKPTKWARGNPVEAAAKCIVLTFVLAVVPGYTCVDTGKIKSLFSGPTYAGFAATDVAERLAGSVAGTVLAVIA